MYFLIPATHIDAITRGKTEVQHTSDMLCSEQRHPVENKTGQCGKKLFGTLIFFLFFWTRYGAFLYILCASRVTCKVSTLVPVKQMRLFCISCQCLERAMKFSFNEFHLWHQLGLSLMAAGKVSSFLLIYQPHHAQSTRPSLTIY